jgi:membrane protein DedA with SNARE-associated domain
MLETVIHWIQLYGYEALFVLLVLGVAGLPIPDETLMVFSGALIARGTLQWPQTWATAFVGSVCGITLSYCLGKTLGLGAVHRFGRYVGLTQPRLDQVHTWFDRVGHWALFGGYYIAGVRHFTAVVAGTSGLEWASFALYAYSGAALWVTTFLSIGYLVGENWATIAEELHRHLTSASIVLLALAALYLLVRLLRRGGRSS